MDGPFSAVSKPTSARKYSLFSIEFYRSRRQKKQDDEVLRAADLLGHGVHPDARGALAALAGAGPLPHAERVRQIPNFNF